MLRYVLKNMTISCMKQLKLFQSLFLTVTLLSCSLLFISLRGESVTVVGWLTQRIPLVSAFWEKFLKFGMWLDITILKTIRGGHTLCLNFWPLFRWKSKMAAKDYITKTKLCIFQYMSKKQKISSPYSKTSYEKIFKKYE